MIDIKTKKTLRIEPQSIGPLHFVGIGGIGMSGIAEILHALGYTIQGSDLATNQNVERLQKQGVKTFEGHDASQVEGAGVVVISSDVKADNVEVVAARAQKIPVISRAEMLAELMRLKPAIAIAGTHGKTTTTSIGAAVLEGGGVDPTVVSGGIINAYGTNARLGSGEWIIVEADESDGTFTKLPATIGVVTNIDPEHMEHYGSLENLHQAFYQFIGNIPFYGLGIVCFDHEVVRGLLPRWQDKRLLTYGFSEGSDVRALNLRFTPEGMRFDVVLSDHVFAVCKKAEPTPEIKDIFLSMVGEHNVQNALSILAMGLELGVSVEDIKKGLAQFSGVRRRFTKTGIAEGVTVIDDYAHHPAEIEVVLKTAAKSCSGRVIAVVQPHRYSRFQALFSEFSGCFSSADVVIVTPIYGARENPIPGVSHHDLCDALKAQGKEVYGIESETELAPLVQNLTQAGDMVVCMGAGPITHWAYRLPADLEKQESLDPITIKRAGT